MPQIKIRGIDENEITKVSVGLIDKLAATFTGGDCLHD